MGKESTILTSTYYCVIKNKSLYQTYKQVNTSLLGVHESYTVEVRSIKTKHFIL